MADGTVQLYFGRNYGGIGIMVYGSRRNGVLRMTCFLKVLGDMPKIFVNGHLRIPIFGHEISSR